MAIALAMLAYGFLNSAQSLAQDTGSGSDSPQLTSLAATGTGRAMYPAFDSNTLHYAVGCGDNSILSLTLAASSGASLAINSATQSSNSLDGHQISGLNGDSDTAITVSKDGASRTYTVHCVHDDFPVLSVSKTDKAWDGLITLHTIDASRHGANTTSFIMIVDNNGVPQKHRRLPNEGISHFRTQLHGPYPYSYQAYKGTLSEPVFNRNKTCLL